MCKIKGHKSLRDENVMNERLSKKFENHVKELNTFVSYIRKKTNKDDNVPYFDPCDGGANAKCLFLFEAPGSKAVKTGFISRDNPDGTAKNFSELNDEAKLDRKLTVSWNIIPWYIGNGKKIS